MAGREPVVARNIGEQTVGSGSGGYPMLRPPATTHIELAALMQNMTAGKKSSMEGLSLVKESKGGNMGDFRDILRKMGADAENIVRDPEALVQPPEYDTHRCTEQGYFIRRHLRSGASVLQFDCGHIQLRQKSEPLPSGHRA